MIVGASVVPDRSISTTERLSDRKLTRLEAHRGPQRYTARTIGNVPCTRLTTERPVSEVMRLRTSDTGKLFHNQEPQRRLKKPRSRAVEPTEDN